MKRVIFEPEHEIFRESVGRFFRELRQRSGP